MKKKFLILIFTTIAVLVSTFVWDFIKLPFNFENMPYGEYARLKYHPTNDTLRYLFFISVPLITFFVTYLMFYKSELWTIKQVLTVNFSNNLKNNNNTVINFFFYLISFLLVLSFLSIDFDTYYGSVDLFHEGTLLTPPKNFQFKGGIWSTTFLEYGLFANFYPYIVWKIFSVETVGSVRFFEAIILLFNKILLVFLSKKISENLNFDKEKTIFYFVFLSIYAITLVDYGSTSISTRSFLIIFFLLTIFNSLQKNNNFFSINFLIGLFSASSMFWWIDVGAFINAMIFIFMLYLLYRQEFEKIFIVLAGLIFGWAIAFIFLPINEIAIFFDNTIIVLMQSDWMDGLIYPTPFFSGDVRATKALLLIIFTGILTIIFNFNKKINAKNEVKTFFLFFYALSVLGFKSAMLRSDSAHIKLSTGLLNFLLISIILYFVFIFLTNQNTMKKLYSQFQIFIKKIYLFVTLTILFIFFFFISIDSINFKRTMQSYGQIKQLITVDDNFYMRGHEDYIGMLNYYNNITKDENCVQIFTNESAIPYFLNKPTCTKFYSMWMVAPYELQEEFIKELKNTKPKIILLDSQIDLYNDSRWRLAKVYDFLRRNYKYIITL